MASLRLLPDRAIAAILKRLPDRSIGAVWQADDALGDAICSDTPPLLTCSFIATAADRAGWLLRAPNDEVPSPNGRLRLCTWSDKLCVAHSKFPFVMSKLYMAMNWEMLGWSWCSRYVAVWTTGTLCVLRADDVFATPVLAVDRTSFTGSTFGRPSWSPATRTVAWVRSPFEASLSVSPSFSTPPEVVLHTVMDDGSVTTRIVDDGIDGYCADIELSQNGRALLIKYAASTCIMSLTTGQIVCHLNHAMGQWYLTPRGNVIRLGYGTGQLEYYTSAASIAAGTPSRVMTLPNKTWWSVATVAQDDSVVVLREGSSHYFVFAFPTDAANSRVTVMADEGAKTRYSTCPLPVRLSRDNRHIHVSVRDKYSMVVAVNRLP